jgi:2-dehydro-3-deoxyphosphogluconate aldolase/(4S)-4-hydroxy-2-oxoglutarate aldolase
LNTVRLLPTGGVSAENCEAFFKAGASGVGMGSNLFPADLINNSDWDSLAANFRKYVSLLKNIASTSQQK